MSLKPYSKFSIVDATVAPSIDQEVLHRGSKQAKELTMENLHKDEVKSQICHAKLLPNQNQATSCATKIIYIKSFIYIYI